MLWILRTGAPFQFRQKTPVFDAVMKLRGRLLAGIVIAWACAATLIALIAIWRHFDDVGVEFGPPKNVEYYQVKDRQQLNLPVWRQTNDLPLPPEAAIKGALEEVHKRYAGGAKWSIRGLELEPQGQDIWVYKIKLVKVGEAPDFEIVRVLMNGEIWQPKKRYD